MMQRHEKIAGVAALLAMVLACECGGTQGQSQKTQKVVVVAKIIAKQPIVFEENVRTFFSIQFLRGRQKIGEGEANFPVNAPNPGVVHEGMALKSRDKFEAREDKLIFDKNLPPKSRYVECTGAVWPGQLPKSILVTIEVDASKSIRSCQVENQSQTSNAYGPFSVMSNK